MRATLTRAQLLSRGAHGGATLLIAGPAFGALAGVAEGAPPSAGLGVLVAADLAYVRLLIGVELLLVDFYANAIASGHLGRAARYSARLALVNETEHHDFLAYVLGAAGLTALTAADIDFSYPTGSYYSAASVTKLAVALETLALGSYLGAAGEIANPVLAAAVAQITANEAQHLSAFSIRAAQPAFHDAFPAPLTIEEASNALDTYAS